VAITDDYWGTYLGCPQSLGITSRATILELHYEIIICPTLYIICNAWFKISWYYVTGSGKSRLKSLMIKQQKLA